MEAQAVLIVARALHFASLMVLFGAALFPRSGLPDAGGAAVALERRTYATARVAAGVGLASGLLWLAASIAAMAGDLSAAFDPMGWTLVLGTPFGQLWLWRMGLAAVLTGLLLVVRPPLPLVLIGGGVLLGSLALTGHAAVTEGPAGWLHRGSDALHLLAAGGWVGALWMLAYLLRRERYGEAAAAALVRFSGAGSVFAAVLVVTGVVNGWMTLDGLAQVIGGAYGQLLLLKVALVAGMLALAALNRFRLAPAFAADAEDKGQRLRVTVGAEQILALLVVALVAVIGTLDPAD